jgi:hypothetical protein
MMQRDNTVNVAAFRRHLGISSHASVIYHSRPCLRVPPID